MQPDPKILQGFLRIGVFVGFCSFVMIFMQPRDSPEFVVSVCSTIIGVTLVAGVSILIWISDKTN